MRRNRRTLCGWLKFDRRSDKAKAIPATKEDNNRSLDRDCVPGGLGGPFGL